jgi:hypothetical protein
MVGNGGQVSIIADAGRCPAHPSRPTADERLPLLREPAIRLMGPRFARADTPEAFIGGIGR